MKRRCAQCRPLLPALLLWGLLVSLCSPALFGVMAGVSPSPERGPTLSLSTSSPPAGNGSGGDPSGSNPDNLCPTSGPSILGVQWNCVAILNLTEVGFLLAGIGIVAYVFKDSDRAELPGEAREVPVTAEEEEEYQEDRKLGRAYHAPEAPTVEEGE